MRIASLVGRIVLGLMFTVFGLNGFLLFLPMGPMPTGLAGQYVAAMQQSHYMPVVSGLQLLTGVLLLLNLYVPLALLILAPILVNIVLFHVLFSVPGTAMGIVAIALWLLTAWQVRSVFWPLLSRRVNG